MFQRVRPSSSKSRKHKRVLLAEEDDPPGQLWGRLADPLQQIICLACVISISASQALSFGTIFKWYLVGLSSRDFGKCAPPGQLLGRLADPLQQIICQACVIST